jgi:hypothetical protein
VHDSPYCFVAWTGDPEPVGFAADAAIRLRDRLAPVVETMRRVNEAERDARACDCHAASVGGETSHVCAESVPKLHAYL